MSKQTAFLLILIVAAPLGAATANNDDTCDVGLYPAATLLLPYFEVDFRSDNAQTTIFTVTNTGPEAQAARVTLWTDFAYPVLSFNLYLTGYDVQKINLFDVLGRGVIAPDAKMGSSSSPTGRLSDADNPRLDEDTCATLPGALPPAILQRLQSAFTVGRIPPSGAAEECRGIGGVHTNAIGYATIDVVAACTASLPTDPSYFTHEIRYDNVLIGDYIQIAGTQNFAQGNAMVHIRAVPEGGQQSTRRKTNLPRTFYSRYQPAATRTSDARQPLPSVFAARWISGGPGGFETFFKVWREPGVAEPESCSGYERAATATLDAVLFDEEENAELIAPDVLTLPPLEPALPPSALVNVLNDAVFPPNATESLGGWMYFNLHDKRAGTAAATQNWVTASMRSENRFSVDLDAIALGNGCSAPVTVTGDKIRPGTIGPRPNTH